jgi:cyclase
MSRSTSIPASSRPAAPPPDLSRRRFLHAGTLAVARASLPIVIPALASARRADAGQLLPRIATTDLAGATLLQGAGCNVLAMPGPDGALMIDGGKAANADALLAAVKRATGSARIHTLIDTHWHPEQTGANEAVGRGGGVILAHEKTQMYLRSTVYASAVFPGRLAALPEVARPNRATRGDGSLEFAGQTISYGYLPAAHTDGDLFVHVPAMNLLAVGGVASAEGWPLLD